MKEYKTTKKEISIAELWKAQEDIECLAFLDEWAKFAEICLRKCIGWNYIWESDGPLMTDFKEGKGKFANRTQKMLDYMVEHGFLEEVKKNGWPEAPTIRDNSNGSYIVMCKGRCIVILTSEGTLERSWAVHLEGTQADKNGRILIDQ